MAVKASAVITLSTVVDVSAAYRYYLLQSSTLNPPSKPTSKLPGGSWTDTEPTYTSGSTNTLYFVDLTVFSNGTWSYSSVSRSSAYEAAKEAYNRATQAQSAAASAQNNVDKLGSEVLSRGSQLVTNGNGMLGNNTNFSSLVFDPTVANSSNGSFTRTGGSATIFSDEFMALTAGVGYCLEFDARSTNALATMYAMLAFFDADKQSIMSNNHMYVPNTLTTLARELKNGDTKIYLTSAANWNVNNLNGLYTRSVIFWNYVSQSGFVYPELTYSRNCWNNLYTSDASVDKTNNVINLSSAWNHGTFPAGTKLSQGNSGAMYKYIAASNSVIPVDWKHFSGTLQGQVDYTGSNASGKLPPGAAFGKVGFLWNFNGANDQIWVTNISVKEDHTAPLAALEDTIDYRLESVHSQINEVGDSIRQEVQANYASASGMEQIRQQVTSLAEQTENNFTWTTTKITEAVSDMNAAQEATAEQLALIQTYMSFSSNGLTIGKTGNPFTFRVINDRLAFYMNDSEVAYLSNNKLYVTQADILTRLQIGKFAFEPQTNGNMSLVYTG